ncbi:hypothetical protein, partial [Cronobacter sakazakii]|uniref:hypothetical protein n=1 Tax=Cronobacter sakazakii TaxID=28141 RepID=UPI001F3814C5
MSPYLKTWEEILPGLTNLRKTTCQGGFSFTGQEITTVTAGSQEDRLSPYLKPWESSSVNIE